MQKARRGKSGRNERIRDSGGCLLTISDEAVNQWKEYIKELIPSKNGSEVVITCAGMGRGQVKIPVWETVSRD